MPEALHPVLPPAPHGGPDGAPFTGLDFSVNANPYGPNPALRRAAGEADPGRYPDPAYRRLRARLADWHGHDPAGVVPGVGASELLHRAVRAYLPAGGAALSLGAPFGEFARAVRLAQAQLCISNLGTAVADLRRQRPKLVYAGSPHNPTGAVLDVGQLAALLRACAKVDALLLLDEAYAPFLEHAPEVPAHSHLLRLHSPGKAHGLVGLRPAYALAAPGVAGALLNLAPAWALPAPTAAVLEALPDAQAFLAETLPELRAATRHLAAALGQPAPRVPFFLLPVPDAPRAAAELLARGLRVRDAGSYGFPGHLRLSARQPEDNARLVAAWQDLA